MVSFWMHSCTHASVTCVCETGRVIEDQSKYLLCPLFSIPPSSLRLAKVWLFPRQLSGHQLRLVYKTVSFRRSLASLLWQHIPTLPTTSKTDLFLILVLTAYFPKRADWKILSRGQVMRSTTPNTDSVAQLQPVAASTLTCVLLERRSSYFPPQAESFTRDSATCFLNTSFFSFFFLDLFFDIVKVDLLDSQRAAVRVADTVAEQIRSIPWWLEYWYLDRPTNSDRHTTTFLHTSAVQEIVNKNVFLEQTTAQGYCHQDAIIGVLDFPCQWHHHSLLLDRILENHSETLQRNALMTSRVLSDSTSFQPLQASPKFAGAFCDGVGWSRSSCDRLSYLGMAPQ